jgi:CRISPR/Cas system-associated endonuclease Cas1
LERIDHILFIGLAGATVVSRGGRLYVRNRGEYTEVDPAIRVIVGSSFGFVITSDAIGVCVRRHIEIIVTDYAQDFVAIYAPYAPCLTSRASLTMRVRQFAAVADRGKKLRIAKDVVRRKIMTEHSYQTRSPFLDDLAVCKSIADVRHIEAKSAQEWWRQWRDFEVNFVKGFTPPRQWRFKRGTLGARKVRLVNWRDNLRRVLQRRLYKLFIILPLELQ